MPVQAKKPGSFENPFRPGAGHRPPYLAGRTVEKAEFEKLLRQDVVLQNAVLTGLRGVGKTVLLEEFKPLALSAGWVWIGTDLSESASIDERSLCLRLITDLAVVTSGVQIGENQRLPMGFARRAESSPRSLDFHTLSEVYEQTPGLATDKLKAVLRLTWEVVSALGRNGVVFAYDEAQNLADHASKDQFPLSVLLDVFQSLQKENIRFMLVLTGLPTLFPKLVTARTFAERMFRVMTLTQLDRNDSRTAITRPIEQSPRQFTNQSVETICDLSAGYPYFIQFICREVYDIWIQQFEKDLPLVVPSEEILRKLDTDFFSGRWARVTDRQRELLTVIAALESCETEFTVQEVVEGSRALAKPFGTSHVSQMLASLVEIGLIYKNRHGRYSFAVPLLNRFIRRQTSLDAPGLFGRGS